MEHVWFSQPKISERTSTRIFWLVVYNLCNKNIDLVELRDSFIIHHLQCEAPPVISWLTKAPVTIVISTINHSYWSYVHQLRYLGGLTLLEYVSIFFTGFSLGFIDFSRVKTHTFRMPKILHRSVVRVAEPGTRRVQKGPPLWILRKVRLRKLVVVQDRTEEFGA